MFKKTKIAAVSAVVLGLSSMTAQAVSLNEAGEEGQVLIFPYYNVNNNFVTTYSIVNTTDAYKAVKVRFREGKVSSDVLDFNLYLSPQDVFTMQLHKDGVDTILTTTDKSCTQPSISAEGVAFRSIYRINSAVDLFEGYLEVIEMGEVDEDAYVMNVVAGIETEQLIASQGLLHDALGVPADCGVLLKAWDQGSFMQGGAESNTTLSSDIVNPAAPTQFNIQNVPSEFGYYGQSHARGLTSPKGGLVGVSVLVDTANITGFVAEPTSVVNYSTRAQHYLSSDASFYLLPSLASGSVKTSETLGFDIEGNAFEAENEYSIVARDWGLDGIDLLPRHGIPSGVNPMPIADAMLIENLSNQYFLGEGTKTDWVISTPMRKHAIYNDYKYMDTPEGYSAEGFDIPVAGAPTDAEAPVGYWKFLAAADIKAEISYYDREEQKPTTAPSPDDFSPPLAETPEDTAVVPFEREVNILTFNTGDPVSSAIGSDVNRNFSVATGFVDGWATLTFDDAAYDLAGSRYENWVSVDQGKNAQGVPAHGFMAVNFELGRAFVGETFMHFDSRSRLFVGE